MALLQQQMNALKESGLMANADEIHVGVNGTDSDILTASCFCPDGSIYWPNPSGQSELPTMKSLRHWVSANPGWFVFYHHMKGVCYPGNPTWDRWRRCMEKVCVWNWEECVDALAKGYDTVGAHWITHEKYASSGVGKGQRYWGGNFWWSRSDYLMTLPKLQADTHENRYYAEDWIGRGPKAPVVLDFAPHFPMNCPP